MAIDVSKLIADDMARDGSLEKRLSDVQENLGARRVIRAVYSADKQKPPEPAR